MKIKLTKEELGGQLAAHWLRRAGYTLIFDRRSNQESFSRRLSGGFYPRFHLYVQEIPNSTELFFNLHLDHKQASYEGMTRHSADYDGELVEQEASRLRSLLGTPSRPQELPSSNQTADVLHSLDKSDLTQHRIIKKSFWQKLFP